MKNLFFCLFALLLLSSVNSYGQLTPITIGINTTKATCEGGTATIGVDGGEEPYFINWNNGLHGAYQEDLLPGDYTISIVDGTGKDTVVSLTILEDKCSIKASTTFSPNDDGINDTWSISRIGYYPNFTLEIYNRWGQTVHTQKKEYQPWNGKQLNIDVPVGTYYYVIFYDGKDGDHEQGSITIMR